MQCEGDAATYFDSVPHLAAVMDKAMDGVATLADLAVVEASLNSRFPSKIIDQDSVGGDINSLTQEKDEALLAYYNRALSALHRVGCKDAAVGITLTMPEKTVLTSLVDTAGGPVLGPVLGLYESLRGVQQARTGPGPRTGEDSNGWLDLLACGDMGRRRRRRLDGPTTGMRPRQTVELFKHLLGKTSLLTP
ncbi:hypothetical protein CTA1_11287 [Colletotrichum tanaceti]|uniref:Uncharacterized protein n=1 Tax=Colletotrichum tanaceti TaxID=1306861 RepID=A0A4U6XMI4_9PEZI|nr:hypothetical protein CTA1_11287 [Colletotrichum tanaceti]